MDRLKTISALAVAAISESLKDNKIKMVGKVTALAIILNNIVDLFRTVPRYIAGLQGSLEMAKERQRSIKETGIDPFDNGIQDTNSFEVKKINNKKWVEIENDRKKQSSSPNFRVY